MTPGAPSRAPYLVYAASAAVNVLLLPACPLLIAWPAFAGIPALLFGGLFAAFRRKIALAAALAWLLYPPYEYSCAALAVAPA